MLELWLVQQARTRTLHSLRKGDTEEMSETQIRESFRQRERGLNQKYQDARDSLYETRREQQRRAEDDYLNALRELETQLDQELRELDRLMMKELEAIKK